MAGRGRKPDPALDAAVREAVLALLFDRGFEMTFDEVAARAGVGRATVFRRYPTKRDLILDTLKGVTFGRLELPDTGTLRGDLVDGLTQVVALFEPAAMRTLVRRFVAEACRDPAFTDLFQANLEGRLEFLTAMLERGIERGELAESVDRRLIADTISGVLILRVVTDQPLPGREEIEQLVDGIVEGHRPAPA